MTRPRDISQDIYERAEILCDQFRDVKDDRELVARVLMKLESRPARAGLTYQQLAALDFIESYQAEHRVAPSYNEIKEALGLASKSGVHRLVHGLKDRGAIVMMDYRTRSMTVRRAA